VDEAVHPGEQPRDYVLRVAQSKAGRVARARAGALVLAADTSVVVDGEILGKPKDPDDARRMLRRLSDRSHQVLSAVALDGCHRDSTVVETVVRFRKLEEGEIDWYVRTGEPLDKAGAYGIQGLAGMFVRSIEGSSSNVIGLPLAETVELLSRAGHPLPWRTA
jgi:septum formation protein